MTRRKNDYSDWSKEELIDHIWQLRKRKKYGLVWDVERTKEKFETENCLPILVEDPELAIETNQDQPPHILIEGDNYHALSVLNYTHHRSIDVIYIDPPFNTGAKDWKYNNDYVDAEDAYRHSKWINMMEKRLRLAKNLLSETGFLICAIDENEVHNLRHLLDDIFGEKNKVGMITVLHNPKGRNLSKFFSENSEFMFVYARNQDVAKFNKVAIDEDKKATFDRKDEEGRYRLEPFMRVRSTWSRNNKPKNYYPIYVSKNLEEITHEKIEDYIEVFPKTEDGREWAWKNIKNTFKQKNKGDYFHAAKEDGQIVIYHKYREQQVFKNVWIDKKYQSEFHGTNILKEIFGEIVFDYPKSIYLVEDILKITSQKNSIILDFFAGSGTTAHSVINLNNDDGGNRQCILVTNNENNIMTDVCYPRVKRVMKGYKYHGKVEELVWERKIDLNTLRWGKADDIYQEYDDNRKEVNQKFDDYNSSFNNNIIRLFGVREIDSWKVGLGGNLRFYRTDFVPADPTDENKETLTFRATEMLCLRENTFDFVEEEDLWKIFENDQQYTGILYDQLKIHEFKVTLEKLDHKPINVYVFSYGDDNFGPEFSDMGDRVNVQSIPEAILRVYRRIYQ